MSSEFSLQDRLVAVTIGGSSGQRSSEAIAEVFTEYLAKALPGAAIQSVEPIITAASLNSIIARVELQVAGKSYNTVAKAHIESHTGKSEISSAAGVREYEHAGLLKDAGWPVLAPLEGLPLNSEYPVLVYPYLEASTYFDLLEESYRNNKEVLTEADIETYVTFEKVVGAATVETAKIVGADVAKSSKKSPVQALFYDRVAIGGRVDQWYRHDTSFELPGIGSIDWQSLCSKRWIINGREYSQNLSDVIEGSRQYLCYKNTETVVAAIAHGDDHSGNIFADRSNKRALTFDPAFGGWNPAALCHVKSYMHTGLLPMAGLYYPSGITTQYQQEGGYIKVEIDWEQAPLYTTHQRLAASTIDNRVVPLFKRMKELGVDVDSEIQRFFLAASTCCYLVINVAKLLEENRCLNGKTVNGTGIGLLPLAIMCAEFTGLPQLDYAANALKALVAS